MLIFHTDLVERLLIHVMLNVLCFFYHTRINGYAVCTTTLRPCFKWTYSSQLHLSVQFLKENVYLTGA